jgi:hypothetical protein
MRHRPRTITTCFLKFRRDFISDMDTVGVDSKLVAMRTSSERRYERPSLSCKAAALRVAVLAAVALAGDIAHAADPDIAPPLDRLQPALLKAEFGRLAAQRKGTTDVYAIGVAGWSEQDVFLKELNGAFGAMSQALPIKNRTLRLVNNPSTAKTVPLASRQNFAAAVHGVAQRMDKAEDVLVLFVTSHGQMAGVSLQMPAGNQAVLTPQDVAGALDGEGIVNRVVIVSACYSGAFVQPLANHHTIVLTASDAWNPSFGCAPGREWTYFGDALFKQSLEPGTDFKRAFLHARVLIDGWEKMDSLKPSNPQGFFGESVSAKLAPLFDAMPKPE